MAYDVASVFRTHFQHPTELVWPILFFFFLGKFTLCDNNDWKCHREIANVKNSTFIAGSKIIDFFDLYSVRFVHSCIRHSTQCKRHQHIVSTKHTVRNDRQSDNCGMKCLLSVVVINIVKHFNNQKRKTFEFVGRQTECSKILKRYDASGWGPDYWWKTIRANGLLFANKIVVKWKQTHSPNVRNLSFIWNINWQMFRDKIFEFHPR